MATASKTYSLRLPIEVIEALQSMALVTGVPAADLGRQAVEEFLVRSAGEIDATLKKETKRRELAAAQVKNFKPAPPDSLRDGDEG